MNYKIYNVNTSNDELNYKNKINNIVKVEWKDDIDKLQTFFNFQTDEVLTESYIKFFEPYADENVLFGKIIDRKHEKEPKFFFTYSGYDMGYFAIKTSLDIQFNETQNVFTALEDTCKKANLEVGEIEPELSEIPIQKIFRKETVSNILSYILKVIREHYKKDLFYYDFTNGKLNLKKYAVDNSLEGYIANYFKVRSVDTITDYSISETVEDDKTICTPEFTMQGNYKMHKGVIIPIQKEKFGISGDYLITKSEHTIVGATETVKITTRKVAEYQKWAENL